MRMLSPEGLNLSPQLVKTRDRNTNTDMEGTLLKPPTARNEYK